MADIRGLRPDVRSAWSQALVDLGKAGITPRVESGYRPAYPGDESPYNPGVPSPATPQSTLYAAYLARGRTGTPAAAPGRSNHQQGAALDISIPSDQRAAALPILQRYGFANDVRGDPSHFDYRGNGDGGGGVGSSAAPVLTPIQQMAVDTANRYGIPPAKLLALVQTESNFNPNAVNANSGAQGLGQFMPATARGRGLDTPFDPQANLNSTAAYLKELQAKTGSWDGALASYGGYGGDVGRAGTYIGRNAQFEQQWQAKLGSQPNLQAAAPSPSTALRQRLLGTAPVVDPSKLAGMLQPVSPAAPSDTPPSLSTDLRQRLLGSGPVVDPNTISLALQPATTQQSSLPQSNTGSTGVVDLTAGLPGLLPVGPS